MIDPPDDETLVAWLDEVFSWDASQTDDVAGPSETIAYGDHPDQVADVWMPHDGGHGATVLSLHGGYFAAEYTRALHVPVVRELVRRGFTVWNVEYRRAPSAGLAETTQDVWAAVDLAAAGSPSGRLAVFGHSAGGFLAEWVAAHPAVELVLALGAVTDLDDIVRAGCDDGAVLAWMGASPAADPVLYAEGELRHRWPTGARHVLAHGVHDATVPIRQSRSYSAAAAAAGEHCTLVELADTGHYAFLDPRLPAFEVIDRELRAWHATSSDRVLGSQLARTNSGGNT